MILQCEHVLTWRTVIKNTDTSCVAHVTLSLQLTMLDSLSFTDQYFARLIKDCPLRKTPTAIVFPYCIQWYINGTRPFTYFALSDNCMSITEARCVQNYPSFLMRTFLAERKIRSLHILITRLLKLSTKFVWHSLQRSVQYNIYIGLRC